jgi:hypothetical protein
MKAEIGDITGRAKSFSEQVQKEIESLASQFATEGKKTVRQAVGAPSDSALWQTFGAGVLIGAIVGLTLGFILSRRNGGAWDDLGDKVRGAFRRETAGDGQPVGTMTGTKAEYAGGYGQGATGPGE